MSIYILKFSLFTIVLLMCFIDNSFENKNNKLSTITKGFGPYYILTRSVDKCETASTLDKENEIILNIKVNKTSRIDEEYVGNATIQNDIQIVKGVAEIMKWQDGGFRIEFKKIVYNPCTMAAFSLILNMVFKADKNCNIKKGSYKIASGLNPNKVLHLLFNSYHYQRYLFKLEWHTKNGSLGCFQTMCEVKPLRTNRQNPIQVQ